MKNLIFSLLFLMTSNLFACLGAKPPVQPVANAKFVLDSERGVYLLVANQGFAVLDNEGVSRASVFVLSSREMTTCFNESKVDETNDCMQTDFMFTVKKRFDADSIGVKTVVTMKDISDATKPMAKCGPSFMINH